MRNRRRLEEQRLRHGSESIEAQRREVLWLDQLKRETQRVRRRAGKVLEVEGERPGEKALARAPIIRPPLFRLDRIAQLFWSRKTYERVFAPIKADLVHEWMEAETAGRRRSAWFIKWVRGPFTQLSHMAAQVPFSIAKRVVEMFQASK